MSTTEETTLEDDLFRVAEQTTADGRVEVEIEHVREHSGELHVSARLPHGEAFVETMAYPVRDSPEYKFVRLVEHAGYTLSAIGQLEGTVVEAEQIDGEWSIYAPEQTTRTGQLRNTVGSLQWPFYGQSVSTGDGFWKLFVLSPLSIPFSLILIPFDADVYDFYGGYSWALWHITLWALLAVGVWYLFL